VRLLERSVDRVGDVHWERIGVAMGLLACVSIGSQVLHELSSPRPSSLSWLFVLGFTLVYSFWFLYGLRFRRLAIWLPNAIAVVLQILLAAGVALKARAG
jgi:uncharacterized protein with PQ loop repeat